MDDFAIWLRNNLPDGWALPVLIAMTWAVMCVVWGLVWGFIFADITWIISSGWGRFWAVLFAVWLAFGVSQ